MRDLQQRSKWTTAGANVRIGDVVIIHEDNLPPQKWLLGKIEEVEASSDGRVRVAGVRTKTGVFRRPIHKLSPLPIIDSQAEINNELQPCKGAGVATDGVDENII